MQLSANTRFYQTIIKYSFFLLFILVPLLLTPWNYELFEYNKMMAVYILTATICSSWIAKMVTEKQIRVRRTILDLPILLFAGSQLVSTLFSIDPHVSWLGYYSRFNGGMWSIISYTLLYFAFTSNADLFVPKAPEVKPAKTKHLPNTTSIRLSLPPLVIAAIISASFVAIYGVLERLGIDKHIWVQDVQNRVFSTLGQPNWLAAYIVAMIPATLALSVIHKKMWSLASILWAATSVLLFCVLLFTKSRSGLIGLAVADVVWCALALFPIWKNTQERKVRLLPIIALHSIFAVIVFINGTGSATIDKWVTFTGLKNLATHSAKTATQEPTQSQGPALEVGGTESAVIRKYVWQGAITAWRSSTKTLLIGTGTETFAFAFYQHRPSGHNLTSEWDFLYNKAHNEYLNFLATTGILGLGTYMLFIGTFIYWYLRATVQRSHNDTHDRELLTLTHAIFAGWISLLITNFFGFSVVIGQVFFFLFPALCILLLESKDQMRETTATLSDTPAFLTFLPVTIQTRSLAVARAVVVLVGLVGVIATCIYWYADVLYAQGYHLGRSGSGVKAVQYIAQAIALNPREPLYHDELSGNYAALSLAAYQNKQATEAAELSQLALLESNKALSTSPKNVNFWKTRTKIFYTLSSIDPALNDSAIEALKQASLLSPNDPKIYYNLAILTGRTGNTEAAIAYLLKAKELKKNYRDVYFALYVFYTEMKKPVDAKTILVDYVTNIDAQDKDFQDRISKL